MRVMIRGRFYKAHRLAWVWMTGAWPEFELDHINLDKADNRFANLRQATHAENGSNRIPQSNNTSGYKAVNFSVRAKLWRARAKVRGKEIHLETLQDAGRGRPRL